MKHADRLKFSKLLFGAIPVLCLVAVLLMAVAGCSRKESAPPEADGKLRVVTTLFPLYDFARTIAGDRAVVTLLLPPGMEPHSFEPKPEDIVRINKAGLFVYTNRVMEPWAEKIIKGVEQGKLAVVDAGEGVKYRPVPADDDHDHGQDGHEHARQKHGSHEHAGGLDPHIWLDFANAQLIVDNILAGFVAVDSANAEYYRKNAASLKAKLADLDRRYREGLQSCATRDFLHGGHYTFGYLAQRYGLNYHSLSGISSDSEPSASRMTAMVRQIRQSGVRCLFAEELLSPRLSETLAAEAGVKVLVLHGAHNLARDDFQRGATFIGLMEENLGKLQKGLGCGVK